MDDKQLTFKMKVLRFTKKYKKQTTRHTLIATVVIVSLLVLFPVGHFFLMQGQTLAAENDQTTFTASFVGDMVFNSFYDKSIEKNGTEDFSKYLNSYLESSNYVTGNLLGSITQNETSLMKAFNFSVVNVYQETVDDLKVLDNNGIVYTGTSLVGEKKIAYQQINNLKVATIGTSQGRYVSDLAWIKQAKQNADMVVVHINWKDKYDTKVNDTQKSIAKAISDAGADIIVGHNTEVLQPIELYNNTIIMYSLGNFLHGEAYSITTESALVQYNFGADGTAKTLKVIPLSLAYGRPQPALTFAEGTSRKNIFDILSRELPAESLSITENGVLNIKLN